MKIMTIAAVILASSFISVYSQFRSDFVLVAAGYDPRITLDSQGRLHATTWKSDRKVYYGLFDSLGQEIRAPRIISSSNPSQTPTLDLSSEYTVVVWRRLTVNNSSIRGQLLAINGDTISSNVYFNDLQGDFQSGSPDVTFLNDSTYIVVWSGDGPDTPFSNGIYGQIATTSRRFIGNNLLLSDHGFPGVRHRGPKVLRFPFDEEFVVLWWDDHLGSNKVFGRLFLSDGIPQDSSFVISDDPEPAQVWNLSAAINPTGGFAVVWSAEKDSLWQIQWRRFQADGTPLGPSESVNSKLDVGLDYPAVDIAFDGNGQSVVVWTQEENGYSKIYAQRFLLDGEPLGGNFKVSVMADTFNQYFPSVILNKGKIYTAWYSIENSIATTFNTRANILDFDNPILSVESQSLPIPTSFQLFQNYPNPFNPTTTISWEVPRQAHIQLIIFNILGEEIITLIDKEVMPATHQVVWDGKDANGGEAPSGLYLYRLRANGDYIQTKKMVLLR